MAQFSVASIIFSYFIALFEVRKWFRQESGKKKRGPRWMECAAQGVTFGGHVQFDLLTSRARLAYGAQYIWGKNNAIYA